MPGARIDYLDYRNCILKTILFTLFGLGNYHIKFLARNAVEAFLFGRKGFSGL
jgi:hypothetical protein